MTAQNRSSERDGMVEQRRLTREHIDWLDELLARGLTVRIRATGNSMRPFIRSGSLISFRRLAGPVRMGDVVLVLEHGHRPLFHRVHRIEERADAVWIQTHGDGAARPDAFVPSTSVLGRVVRVEEARTAEWLATAVALQVGRLGARWAIARRGARRLGSRAKAAVGAFPRGTK